MTPQGQLFLAFQNIETFKQHNAELERSTQLRDPGLIYNQQKEQSLYDWKVK